MIQTSGNLTQSLRAGNRTPVPSHCPASRSISPQHDSLCLLTIYFSSGITHRNEPAVMPGWPVHSDTHHIALHNIQSHCITLHYGCLSTAFLFIVSLPALLSVTPVTPLTHYSCLHLDPLILFHKQPGTATSIMSDCPSTSTTLCLPLSHSQSL